MSSCLQDKDASMDLQGGEAVCLFLDPVGFKLFVQRTISLDQAS
jgi:hypothetical protein